MDHGLKLLTKSPSSRRTLKKLVLIVCDRINNIVVEHLQRMNSLEHLQLFVMRATTLEIGVVAISKIRTLKTLKLHYLLKMLDTSVVVIAQNCHNLEVVDLQGCQRVTRSGIRAFLTHKCLKRLLLLGLRNLHLSDVEYLALGCPSLEPESVLVTGRPMEDPTWSPQLMHINTRRAIKFDVLSRHRH